MRTLLTLLTGFALAHASAQQVLVRPGTDDPFVLRFDPTFIARNRVKSITGQAQVKRENEPMRPRNERTVHLFTRDGKASYTNTSFGRPGTGLDTASVTHTHDEAGHLRETLRNDLNGFYTLRYEVDGDGQVVRETHARITNNGPDRYHFAPGAITVISDERYTWTRPNDTTQLRTFLNDRGLPYREQTCTKDRLGYLRSIQDRFLISGRRGSFTFDYDEKGRLRERTERMDGGEVTRHVWTYDRNGTLASCDLWRSGARIKHMEYLYEEGTLLLKAVLTQDMGTGLIHVVKYTTERHAD